jgi:hypothetical protein
MSVSAATTLNVKKRRVKKRRYASRPTETTAAAQTVARPAARTRPLGTFCGHFDPRVGFSTNV